MEKLLGNSVSTPFVVCSSQNWFCDNIASERRIHKLKNKIFIPYAVLDGCGFCPEKI